jgi:hypothetical protein
VASVNRLCQEIEWDYRWGGAVEIKSMPLSCRPGAVEKAGADSPLDRSESEADSVKATHRPPQEERGQKQNPRTVWRPTRITAERSNLL